MQSLSGSSSRLPSRTEAIGQRREELSKVEQQQARALTAAESNGIAANSMRSSGSQGREELERLTQEQQQGAAEAAALEDMLAALERECVEREQVFTRRSTGR